MEWRSAGIASLRDRLAGRIFPCPTDDCSRAPSSGSPSFPPGPCSIPGTDRKPRSSASSSAIHSSMAPRASSAGEPATILPGVQLALLGPWIGASGFFAVAVAPAAFAALPSRELAGALVGRLLPILFWSGATVGLVVLLLE